MTPGYPFRLYASPWKLGVWLVISAALVILAYVVLADPGSQLDMSHAIAFWALALISGVGVVAFAIQFVMFGVARRPMLEITHEGWAFHPFPYSSTVTRMAWSEIARVEIYRRREGGWLSTYTLAVIRRSEELPAEKRKPGEDDWSVPARSSGYRERMMLDIAYLRVTPTRCERLLDDIKSAFASEIAQYDVCVEPAVDRQ